MRSLLVAGLVASLLAESSHADSGDRWDAATIGVQVGGGVGGGVLGALALGLTGGLIGKAVGPSRDWGAPLVGAALGVIVGGLSGFTIGVQLSGDARDGTGRWWGTTGGTIVGTGAVVGLVLATEDTGGYVIPKFAAGFILIAGSAIAGYHLSGDDRATMATPLTLRF